MRKRQLEIQLERIESFSSPALRLEQYATPATVAAELLHLAYMRGELETVVDLGSGTGVLAIGAALLGARAIGVEIDPSAIAISKRNAALAGVHVDIIRGDIRTVGLRDVPTVVMNPPFGAQKASRGDRDFLTAACRIAQVVYSIHNRGSEEFIRRFVAPARIEDIIRLAMPIKRCFDFHTRAVRHIEVELYRIVCR